jgi:protein-tyrosine-phosphatase/predicted ATP-grasp superfamily ATP-dependent carboligase
MAALMRQEEFSLVIPADDRSVIALQTHREALAPLGRLYTLNDAAFSVLFDKLKTNELARSAGVSLAREVKVVRPSDAQQALQEFHFPLVLKPIASCTAADLGIRRQVRKAYSSTEFDRLLHEMLAVGPLTIQENFIGAGVGIELLVNEGEPLLTFQHVRVHEPLHGGGSSYRKSVAVTPELLEAALKILRPLNYTGVAMVEFKVDPRTGRWIFIEVNARFWGSLPLALAAGADFPLALFQWLVEGRISVPGGYRQGIYSRYLTKDLPWLLANLRADRSDPTLATRPIARVLRDAVVNTLTLRERSDTFSLDDPAPALAESGQLGRNYGEAVSSELLKRSLTVPLVRATLRRRAARALRRARSVLFVCHGNICRSPFAEHLARDHWPEMERILSAGFHEKGGRSSPANAVAAAERWSLDLGSHRSRVVSEEMLRQADLIFVFDVRNYRQMARQYRFALPRVHFLGALCPEGSLLIGDPWGLDMTEFERAYERTACAIRHHMAPAVRRTANDATEVALPERPPSLSRD